ncbi:MAG: ABC transporter ATP-binding protein [Trueperaceae bacterium]|nr:ABC transporter ATP-binding protein [Trueperaceae bacterium]MCO5173019.1 ABC transporter ATP-binding protein/permease [Trueperaceae bacterium]MCW5820225.1 ABC transporter ATP-binding protein [Trueperaceae bacterium]
MAIPTTTLRGQGAQPPGPQPPGSQAQGEFAVAGLREYDRRSPLRWVLSHLLQFWPLLFAFLACAVGTNVLVSIIPRVTGDAFDLVISGQADARALLRVGLLILGLVAARGVLDLAMSFSVETLGQRLERDARHELYVALLGKSQTFHNRNRVGDVMARAANDVRQLNPMMNPGVALITESLASLVTPMVFIALIDVRLLLAPALFVVSFYFALRSYMRQLEPVSTAQRQQFGVLNAALNETITGIMVVKSTVREDAERLAFARNAKAFRDYFVKAGLVQARYLPLLLIGLAVAGAFAHGLYLLAHGAISTGDLVAYMGLMAVMRFPAFISIFTFYLVQMGMAGARRILDLITAEVEMDENAAGHNARIAGALAFDGVTFAYEGAADAKEALKDVSFEVAPCQTVAVVGQTGSGKSSITKLVNRIYDPTQGRVLIDGVDARDWNLEALRSQVSVIEQDVFLFSRSVAENIAFGLGESATRERVVEAAKAAQAHEFIMAMPEGYDTVIGERGATLSGGQRQRLAIARALLTDPRILILDDSTSAIDSATEDAIQRAINAVLEGRTTLMITHRLAQIRRADLVLLMHGGRVVARGNHQELLAGSDLYRRIFARQD